MAFCVYTLLSTSKKANARRLKTCAFYCIVARGVYRSGFTSSVENELREYSMHTPNTLCKATLLMSERNESYAKSNTEEAVSPVPV